MKAQVENEILAPVAFDRAKVLAPLLTLAIAWYAVGGELVGMPLTATSFVVEAAVTLVLIGITAGAWLGRFSQRYGHVVLGAVWWLTMFATLQALVLGRHGGLGLLVIIEIIGVAVVLHTRFVVVSLLLLDAVYLPFLALAKVDNWLFCLTGALGAQVLAFAFHHVFRTAMLEAEQRRRAQAEAATALATKVAEIERTRAERQALAGQLAATERIEATGTLAASFAHQMNNILTGITMTTSLLARRASASRRSDYDVILMESQRGSDLTRALLAFSRRSALEREPHVFDDVVRTRCELIARMLPRTVQLELQLAAPALVSCDVVQIGQLLMNLAMNAADAMDGRGTVIVETTVDAYGVHLRVRDRGHGMDDTTRARVFDPFFTTKPSAKGMGLATAWGIVRGHEGTIAIESAVGDGTTVSVQLPVVMGVMS